MGNGCTGVAPARPRRAGRPVAAAYGSPADLPEEDVLLGLLTLNLERKPA